MLFLPAMLFAIQYPAAPELPQVEEPDAAKDSTKKIQKTKPVTERIPVRVKIHLGDKSAILAEALLPRYYAFSHKKGQITYEQTISAADIRELAIESYRARRVGQNEDGEIFEFEPASVRIELKDGQVFKLNYLFKDLRKVRAKNADGAFTVYAYFADTWRGNAWRERPEAPEKPRAGTSRTAHPAAFTKLEYYETLSKSNAAGDSAER